jgi:hypothetical protein
MRRREFITLLSSVAAWSLEAHAEPRERMRRIGALMSRSESDPQGLELITAFAQGLAELGWTASAVTCGSNTAGAPAIWIAFAPTRRN